MIYRYLLKISVSNNNAERIPYDCPVRIVFSTWNSNKKSFKLLKRLTVKMTRNRKVLLVLNHHLRNNSHHVWRISIIKGAKIVISHFISNADHWPVEKRKHCESWTCVQPKCCYSPTCLRLSGANRFKTSNLLL